MDIQAAVTHQQGDPFKLEAAQLADPKFDEIRIRIMATGVCHTDVVARDLGIAPFPIVLGHEERALSTPLVQAYRTCKSVIMWCCRLLTVVIVSIV